MAPPHLVLVDTEAARQKRNICGCYLRGSGRELREERRDKRDKREIGV